MPKATVGAGGGGGKKRFLRFLPTLERTKKRMSPPKITAPHFKNFRVREVTFARVVITSKLSISRGRGKIKL